MRNLKIILVLVAVCCLGTVLVQGQEDVPTPHKPNILDILPPNYYRDVAPTQDGKAVMVTVSVVVLNMFIHPGATQNLELDIFLHVKWFDYRLQSPSSAEGLEEYNVFKGNKTIRQYKLGPEWQHRLWVPNIHFRNAFDGRVDNIMAPTHYYMISDVNNVFMAVRLHLKVRCDMNFVKYPFDTQTCHVNITTVSETVKNVNFQWDTFRIGSHVDRAEFNIISTNMVATTKVMKDFNFSHPYLFGEIVVKRNIGNYIIKKFVPSIMIVSVTFIGFWIPPMMSPARTTLGITCLLAVITQQIQIDLNVSYIYALQVWYIVCILFISTSLMELAIAIYFAYKYEDERQKEKEKESANAQPQEKRLIGLAQLEARMRQRDKERPLTFWDKFRGHFRTNNRLSSVDRISRYLFPICFAIFVFVFSCWVALY